MLLKSQTAPNYAGSLSPFQAPCFSQAPFWVFYMSHSLLHDHILIFSPL